MHDLTRPGPRPGEFVIRGNAMSGIPTWAQKGIRLISVSDAFRFIIPPDRQHLLSDLKGLRAIGLESPSRPSSRGGSALSHEFAQAYRAYGHTKVAWVCGACVV